MFNSVKESIIRGKEGLNKGIPMGFDRFSGIVPNLQKARYNIIAGGPGSGKSALADTMFVFNPLEWYMSNKHISNIKLKVHYFSYEISKERLLSKQITRKLYNDYNILTDTNYILSFGKNRISQEIYEIVISYADYFDELGEHLTIYDGVGNNPTGVYKTMLDYASINGRMTAEGVVPFKYEENDPDLYTLVVIDHARLVPRERGFNTKENIDKLSEYLRNLRNYFQFSSLLLTQTNRGVGQVERRKLDGQDLAITLDDISDSSSPAQDADLVLGIINPLSYNLPMYRGYDISKMGNRSRFLNIAKNRDGDAEATLGMQFIGECGHFSELPRQSDMTPEIYNNIQEINRVRWEN